MNPTLRDKLDRVLEGSGASLPRRGEWTKNERAAHEVSGLAQEVSGLARAPNPLTSCAALFDHLRYLRCVRVPQLLENQRRPSTAALQNANATIAKLFRPLDV